MQQLTITLIALLCMFAPTANSRIVSFFGRFVPALCSGRVAGAAAIAADTGALSGEPQGCSSMGRKTTQRTATGLAVLHYLSKLSSFRNGAAPDSRANNSKVYKTPKVNG